MEKSHKRGERSSSGRYEGSRLKNGGRRADLERLSGMEEIMDGYMS